MKKSIRFVIVISVVVLLLGVGLIVLLNLPAPADTSSVKNDDRDILLYDKTGSDAEEITIKNSSGEFTLIGFSYEDQVSKTSAESSEGSDNILEFNEVSELRIYMHYTMQDYEDTALSKNMTDQLAYQCSYLTATKLIDSSGTRYADFGLDKPVATVKTVFGDNSEHILLLGKTAPDNQGIYCRLGENKNVYLTKLDSVNMFLIKKLQFFDKTLTAEYDTDNEENSISKLVLSGKYYDKPIEIDTEEDPTSAAEYLMRSPYREIAAKNVVQGAGTAVFGLSGSEVAAANVNDEEKKKFGLDEPYLDITSASSDGVEVHIYASKKNDDGSCYVYSDTANVICKVDAEYIEKWYEKDYKSFLAGVVILPEIKTLKKFTVDQGGTENVYDIESKTEINDIFEETTSIKVTHNGKQIRYENLVQYIKNISGLVRKDMTVSSRDGYDTLASCSFVYDSLTDKLEICKNAEGKYIIVLNGIVEGTVDGSYAEKLIAQAALLDGEELLDSFVDGSDESSSEEASKQTS